MKKAYSDKGDNVFRPSIRCAKSKGCLRTSRGRMRNDDWVAGTPENQGSHPHLPQLWKCSTFRQQMTGLGWCIWQLKMPYDMEKFALKGNCSPLWVELSGWDRVHFLFGLSGFLLPTSFLTISRDPRNRDQHPHFSEENLRPTEVSAITLLCFRNQSDQFLFSFFPIFCCKEEKG